MATYAERIEAALRAKVAGATFAVVRFPAGVRTVGPTTVSAKTVLVEELQAAFAEPLLRRLDRQREKTDWVWLLDLNFDLHVSLEAFEQSMVESPPVIARDLPAGITRQVTLLLLDASFRHPPRQQPSSGTRARYRILAELSPV